MLLKIDFESLSWENVFCLLVLLYSTKELQVC